MTFDGYYYVTKGLELYGELKFRKDGLWEVNFGLPGEFCSDIFNKVVVGFSHSGSSRNMGKTSMIIFLARLLQQ